MNKLKNLDYGKAATYKIFGLMLISVLIISCGASLVYNRLGKVNTGRVVTEQDSEITVIADDDGTTVINQRKDGWYYVTFTPSEKNHFDSPCSVMAWADPNDPSFISADWCGKCHDFHPPRPEYR